MTRMYRLDTPLASVTGIGPSLWRILNDLELQTVKDLILWVPLRYEDRSERVMIANLVPQQLVTLEAEVLNCRTFYKGRRTITNAKIKDETGNLTAMWFNNRFIQDKLKTGRRYFFSGKLNDRGIFLQPVVEDVKIDTIHTDRLVPRYSSLTGIKEGSLRRILKNILDNLTKDEDEIIKIDSSFLDLSASIRQMHFPDSQELVVKARERLALEELLTLMKKSQSIKETWQERQDAPQIKLKKTTNQSYVPKLPFILTTGQQTALAEILQDISQKKPMNRLLVGDVGSGKTVVAGIAAQQVVGNKQSAALVAPTRILAEQHASTLQMLFPDLPIISITSGAKKLTAQPALYIGTHAVINRFAQVKPALIIYDEQHRFGVKQRSQASELTYSPHILTMSATPIPRSLMLTIFAHLQLSTIDELPAGRLPVKTWVVPEKKRADGYLWLAAELQKMQTETDGPAQAFVVCPFIDPSNSLALENVAAVTHTFEELQAIYASQPASAPRMAILHGKIAKKEQNEIVERLRSGEIEILVTTPIVEVGIDVPTANIMVIEAAERFGLASLHQLRGRVGRAGQQAYCLLFSHSKSAQERLEKFAKISKGSELAELDLQYRGAGDIFGTQQHGFDELRFANWADIDLIAKAKKVYTQLDTKNWTPFFDTTIETQVLPAIVPQAN